MRAARNVAANFVLPWLTQEQEFAEAEYRRVATRFVNIGNEFLHRLSESKVPQLSRIPNALNSETGFRVRSHFRFEELIQIAQPASPLRHIADVFLGLIGLFSVFERQALEFSDIYWRCIAHASNRI